MGSFTLANTAVTRLQAILTTFVLRRMKDSMLDGKKLIELPPKTIDLVRLDFMDEERQVYDIVSKLSFELSSISLISC